MPPSNWKRLALLSAATLFADLCLLCWSVASPQSGARWLTSITALLSPPLSLSLGLALYRLKAGALWAARSSEAERLKRAEQVAELQVRTVESLAIAIAAKDQTTHGHVRRSQIYAVGLGEVLGLEADELEALRAGALLYDIGKLAVPDYILNKPGKLTPAEFEKMKTHATVGGDIIRRVGFPFPVEDCVRHHHERWDGSGYPAGLHGEQIPPVARIIALVDYFDTSRCDRPYRPGLTREDALAKLRRMSGSSFDPLVVQKFVEHIDRFEALISEADKAEQICTEVADAPAALVLRNERGGGVPHVDASSGFRSIAEAQREVFALHEIAQTIGASLNLQDTVALVAAKLRSIVPFDACVIYTLDEKTGRAEPAHASGRHAEHFAARAVSVGEGITGWVLANARSMRSDAPELELEGAPAEVSKHFRHVLSSPLVREDGAFGAVTLLAADETFTAEHVRLLESVCSHASSALGNALMHERTKESALTDPLTELPNVRGLHLVLNQRIAECRRNEGHPVSVLCVNLDAFGEVNARHGHGVGDRLLAAFAAVCKSQLREMDVLARHAGDEFVAVMPTASAADAAMVAERLRAAVESHRFAVRTGRTVQLGVSVGVACFPSDGETAGDLLAAAARAMRRDKQTRRLSPGAGPGGPVVSIDSYR